MGRGNVCVHGDFEGLYYIPYGLEEENFYEDLEDDLDFIADSFCRKYKGFTKVDDSWLRDDRRILAESNLFYLAVEDNEWSEAIMLIQKEDEYGEPSKCGLQKKHYQSYLKGLKSILFELYEELGVYAGAWTSGRIQKGEEN